MGIPSRASRSLLLLCALWLQVLHTPHAAAEETATYDYDALGRLIQVTKDDDTVIEYEYDAAGNRKRKEVSTGGSGGSGGSGGGPVNNPPTAVNNSTSINYDFGIRVLNLTANDTDPDGDTLTITAVTQPLNASVTIISASEVRILAESLGLDAFQYTVSDGNGGTDTAMVSVNVWSRGGGDLR